MTKALNDDIVRCEECGLPIPPAENTLSLTPQGKMIYHAVRTRPRTLEQLHNLLYGHDPNGGPDIKIIHVLINQANKKLKSRGLMLRAINRIYYLMAAK
jgi:hypothetical protein